jgi:exodeoxyribonuclease-5
MLKNHLVTLLKGEEEFQLTASQSVMIEKLADFMVSASPEPVFVIRGYAGTGKTTMINQLTLTLDTLNIKSVLLAPTGRAAKVLTGYTGKNAYTIHKKIYRQQSSADGFGAFVLDRNLHKYSWFIVDESSMISNQATESTVFGSGRLLDDLMEYVFSGEGCRLVLAGDSAQLPPVGISVSPALDVKLLEQYGFEITDSELTDVVRQERESGILFNATRIREMIFSDSDSSGFFRIVLPEKGEPERVSGADLMEKLSLSYEKYGIRETTVLTRSNKRANLYNQGIRNSILYRDSEIARGDLLMVVKNNYFWPGEDDGIDFIANGDTGEITHIYGVEELYGFRFAHVSLKLIDYEDVEIECKIILDTLSVETASLSREEQMRLFNAVSEDYADIGNKRERWKKIKADPWFNALQVKFAYAVTCHKAQGGQWFSVFIDTGFLTEEMIDRDFLRWLYTAFTRSKEKLYLVNFDKRFFEEEK